MHTQAHGTENNLSQIKNEKQPPEKFTANNLDLLSPFRVKHWEVTEKQATRKDGGTFTSKNYVLTIVPQQNQELEAEVIVFDKDFQTMKTLAFLHGGFNKIWIKSIKDSSKPRTPNIYTAFAG